MHLVDRHRAPAGRRRLAAPAMWASSSQSKLSVLRDDRGGRGPHLAAKAQGSALSGSSFPPGADDLVFVDGSFANARRENLPNAAVDALAHGDGGVRPSRLKSPTMETRCGLRRPNGEQHAIDAFMGDGMRAQPAVELLVRAFDEQMIVERPENRAEGIRVEQIPKCRRFSRRASDRRNGPFHRGRKPSKKSLSPRRSSPKLAWPSAQHLKVPRAGNEGAHNHSALDDMQTEHREWVAMPRIGNPFYVLVSRSPVNPGHAFASPSLVLKRIAIRLAPA